MCEEVQTDEILTRDKWTQKPVHISVGTDNQLPGPQDYMGVGGDVDPIEFTTMPRKNSNTGYLTTFLTSASQVHWINLFTSFKRQLLISVWALQKIQDFNHSVSLCLFYITSAITKSYGEKFYCSLWPNVCSVFPSQVMLGILEEELLWDLAESASADSANSMEGLGFSNPPAPLGTSVKPLLEGRPVPFVQFCTTEPTLLLSGHGYQSSVRYKWLLCIFFH